MAKKPNHAPAKEQFVKMPRALLESDAWRSIGIKERRVIDFLMLEHLRHAGKDNGRLKAPHRQLLNLGLNRASVRTVLANLEKRDLIKCIKGGMRVATMFRLTWLPTFGLDVKGKPVELLPGHEWQGYRESVVRRSGPGKYKNLPNKDTSRLPNKDTTEGAILPNKDTADSFKNLPYKDTALSRKALPGTPDTYSVLEGGALPVGVVPLRAEVGKRGPT